MNTKHVPNLELCQELDRLCKEKNITLPETEFYWVEATISGEWYLASNADNHYSPATKGFFPAPLVSEQGEWLPNELGGDYGGVLTCTVTNNEAWDVTYWSFFREKEASQMKNAETFQFLSSTEANARQKMLNYLIAEGIITKL